MKTKQTNGFAAMIRKSATTKSTNGKKKSSPIIKLNKEVGKALHDFNNAKAEVKIAKANQAEAFTILNDFCLKEADKNGLNDNFAGTYEIVNGEITAKYILVDRWTVPQGENAEVAKKELKVVWDKITIEDVNVKLKDEVHKDVNLQNDLVKLIGDRFDDFFETEIVYRPIDKLKEKIYGICKSVSRNPQALLNKIRQYIVPAKPSIK